MQASQHTEQRALAASPVFPKRPIIEPAGRSTEISLKTKRFRLVRIGEVEILDPNRRTATGRGLDTLIMRGHGLRRIEKIEDPVPMRPSRGPISTATSPSTAASATTQS